MKIHLTRIDTDLSTGDRVQRPPPEHVLKVNCHWHSFKKQDLQEMIMLLGQSPHDSIDPVIKGMGSLQQE